MEGSIKFLLNFFDKELIVLSKTNNFNKFLTENNLLKENIFIEENLLKREKNIFIISKKTKIYVVKPGDTIESICLKSNTSMEEFFKKNKTNKIFLGQQLNI